MKELPGVRVGNFRKGVIAEMKRRFGEDGQIEAEEALDHFPLVPDAWRLEIAGDDTTTLTCYEVEVTSHLTPEKLGQYAELWASTDAYGWYFRLVRVCRMGGQHEQPLLDTYYDVLFKHAPDRCEAAA